MANKNDDSIIEPEDTTGSETKGAKRPLDTEVPISPATTDPNDVVPVPVVMEPAEIDERAKTVETLRGNQNPPGDEEPDTRP